MVLILAPRSKQEHEPFTFESMKNTVTEFLKQFCLRPRVFDIYPVSGCTNTSSVRSEHFNARDKQANVRPGQHPEQALLTCANPKKSVAEQEDGTEQRD